MITVALLARVWRLGCWLASQRMHLLLLLDPTPEVRLVRIPNYRRPLCAR